MSQTKYQWSEHRSRGGFGFVIIVVLVVLSLTVLPTCAPPDQARHGRLMLRLLSDQGGVVRKGVAAAADGTPNARSGGRCNDLSERRTTRV